MKRRRTARGKCTMTRGGRNRRRPQIQVVSQFAREDCLTGAQKSFSTLHRLAPLHRQNSRLTALKQLPLQPLRFAGRVPEKSSNRAS